MSVTGDDLTKYLIAKLLLIGCAPLCSAPDSVVVHEVYGVQVEETHQQAYMVWEKQCIDEVTMTADARLVAPMRDGVPDMKKSRFQGLTVKFRDNCPQQHVEIIREAK